MIGDKKLNLSVLQFDIFELAIMVTSELKMLQEEGARVGLGGDYQPQPGGGQVDQELVCEEAGPCGGD